MLKKIISIFLLFFHLFSVSFANSQAENTENILKIDNLEINDELKNFNDNFEIKNKFQNPTYLLDKDEEKDQYFCEENKECKVNFDFRTSFSEKFKSKDFVCEIIYLEEKIDNCNPNSITFENKETEIKIKIFNKKDENIFKEKIIKIFKKDNSESQETGTGKMENNNEQNIGTGNINDSDGNGEDDQMSSETENNNQEETGTGKTENSEILSNGQNENKEENQDLKNFQENFEIKNIFQRPTYLLDKDEEKKEYFCENEDDCKVNFDFRTSFSENFKEKDFVCEINFGDEKIRNCNPNFIEIKENIEIKIKIFNKKDEGIFKERIIKIFKKDTSEKQETGTGKIENSEIPYNGQNENKEENQDLKIFQEKFEIKNIFQKGTSLIDKEIEKDIYICEKKDCKVNFDFRESFNEIFKSRNFSCEITFKDEIIKTCNPSTLDILSGSSEIFVKIFNKKNKSIFKEKKYIIKNEILNSNFSRSEITLDKPEIIVQSGISNGKCEKKDCKVNFIYETKNKNLLCKWSFGNGEFKSGSDLKCNPPSVKFPYGKHLVRLKVFEKGNENSIFENFFEFENDFEPEKFEEKIVLDGKSKEFQVLENLAFCVGVSNCKLNFSVKNFGKVEKKYFWDFGNGEIFEGRNPKAVEFKHGKYKISLKVSDDKEEKEIFFYVIVDKNRKKIFEKLFKNGEIENKFSELKYRKNQTNLIIYGKNSKNIFVETRIDFPFIGKIIYDKDFFINIDENKSFKYNFDYDKPGKYIFDFYEIGNNGEKIFKESKKIEITYKNYFFAKFLELENEQKETKNIGIKEKKELEKKEEEKFLKIVMQGKSTKNKYLKGKTIFCNGPCIVNFGLETNIRGGKFLVWDLGDYEKFNGKNPKSKKYQVGNYKIFVRYEDENGKTLEDSFEIKVNKKVKKKRKRKSKKSKVGPVNLVILVQGRLGKNKILEENKLICLKTCSVNFDGRKSSGAYKELIWDFGNGEKFIGENPKSIKYKEPGKYKILLKTEDFKGKKYEKIFEVDFRKISENNEEISDLDTNSVYENDNTFKEKNLKKSDIGFILIIILMTFGFSFVLLRKYKII